MNPAPLAGKGAVWVGLATKAVNNRTLSRIRSAVQRYADPLPSIFAKQRETKYRDLLQQCFSGAAKAGSLPPSPPVSTPLRVSNVIYRLREGGMFVCFNSKDEASRAAEWLKAHRPAFLDSADIHLVRVSEMRELSRSLSE